MPVSDYPAHELQPRNLTKYEIANPHEVVYDFFSMSHLPEHREQLTQVFDLLATGSYNSKLLNRKERSDLVYFFRRLEKMIEAVHIMNGEWEKVYEGEKDVNLNDGKDK
ncbi:MAG: hypothetical protein ABI480_01000 [Chitinophagaceae bacterium]